MLRVSSGMLYSRRHHRAESVDRECLEAMLRNTIRAVRTSEELLKRREKLLEQASTLVPKAEKLLGSNFAEECH